MKPRIKIGSARSTSGTLLELYEHDGQHEILADRQPLMASRAHHSEDELARLACVDLQAGALVLIGGLGMGYTLRATLDLLPADGRALQVELVPEVVEWNRGPLGKHADHPLDDPRAEVVLDNVTSAIKQQRDTLDAIMLDVDNGPSAVVDDRNDWLYTHAGLRAMNGALRQGGRLAIWSAKDDATFLRRMRSNGFEATVHRLHARPGRKSSQYFVFVGRKIGEARGPRPPNRPQSSQPGSQPGSQSRRQPRRRARRPRRG